MKTILSSSTIVLKIHVVHAGATKSIPLDINAPIYAICEHIVSMIREAEPESGKENKDYGLFLPHEMSKNGLWLDNMKNLFQYILKPGDVLEYRYRYRWLTIRTQDEIKKTLLVDDSWTVSELMILVCAKMGILNHEEYSLMKEKLATDPTRIINTPKVFSNEKEQDKLDKKKKKLQTDDDQNWLNPSQTLRQQGIEEQEVLLVQRKYFFSDMNIDTRDPIQLSLLFIQSKEAVLNGKHPVSVLEAEKLAALQCQAELGDVNTQKNKLTKISLKECVPKDYLKAKGIEKRIVKLYSGLSGKDSIEAKREYCSLCRSLKTYGITFFLVKEKIKGKSKLIPRLLGISRDRVLRLDEKTKDILKTWPLTSIRRWAGSFNAFTMDFGEYAPNEYYTAQTSKGEQISQLISGYVDIIIKHQKVQETQNADGCEESSVAETKVEPNQAEIVEHRSSIQNKSFENILKEIQVAIATPTEDLSHAISVSTSSPIDVTCVTSMRLSPDENTLKSDPDDFDNVKISVSPTRNLDILGTDSHYEIIEVKQEFAPTLEDRELESAMSFGTTRSVQNNYSISRNTYNSPETIRTLDHSPDSFMTGGTRICHTIRRLNISQQKLLKNINRNLETLNHSKLLLDEKINVETLKNSDKEEARENIKVLSKEHAIYNLGSMNTEVVQVLRSSKHAPLNATDIKETNGNSAKHLKDIEKSFKIITVHFPSFVDNVRMISEMNNSSTVDEVTEIKNTDAEEETTYESSETLIDAARKLADAFSGMLNAVKPQEEERDLDFRKAILDAANKVGEASSYLFRQITSSDKVLIGPTDSCSRLGKLLQNADRDFEDNLIYLVRTLANATAHLVQTVKTVTQNENISSAVFISQKLIGPVTLAGLATSQLVTCVKILAPTINQANCTNQILAEIEEVKSTIDNVANITSHILDNCGLDKGSSEFNLILLKDVEDAVISVRSALKNLTDHLNSGITVVNFAPRIQSLESFLTAYDKLKNLLMSTSNLRKNNQNEEIMEALKKFLLISGKINDDILFLCDKDQQQDDPLSAAQTLFSTTLVKVLEINKSQPINSLERWKDLHFELDNLVLVLLYEPGTRYISHDQLIHNLFRSAQILITCCYKLKTSYCQVFTEEKVSPECSEVMERSEYILLIMNDLKFDPSNDKILISFIRESEKLAQSCVKFCRNIHNIIPNTSDDIMVDILAVAASQTLAECEHMRETLICVKPIKAHLELSAIAKMLHDQKLEVLQKSFPHINSPKLNLSQLFQISIAMLEKMHNNIVQTLPKPHFCPMFEMFSADNTETSLIVNLYHHLIKMKDIMDADAQVEMQMRFKNALLLMYRLVNLADNMLTSHGQNPRSHLQIGKCVEEIISTVSSLQSKSGNIFDKFKSNILNKQNSFRSMFSAGVSKSNVDVPNSYDFYFEKATMSIKALIESALMCRQNFGSPKLLDNLQQLYEAFDNVAMYGEPMITLSKETRIIDDFIVLSLSLLNFVIEIENNMATTDEQLVGTRISNKLRSVTESATKIQQTFSRALKAYRNIFNDIIYKLSEFKNNRKAQHSNYPSKWDKIAFSKILNENSIIKSNSEALKQKIDAEQIFENSLMAIIEAVLEICVTIYEKYRPFDERNQVIGRTIDLSLNIINVSIDTFRSQEYRNNSQKLILILKDLTDNVSYLINCIREQIPGYKECSSALAVVAHLSHDIHEIEFRISAENENVKDLVNFKEENKKKCANWLNNMANSVLCIQSSLENEIVPDEKLPSHIEEFSNHLTELMSLIINFTKTESVTSEVKSYVGYANGLVDNADRYLQDVKQYFENIGIGTVIHTDIIMKDLMKQIVAFLQLFDLALAQNLVEKLESRNKNLNLPECDQNSEMANTMSGMITDDDTTILFASAGIKNIDFENYHKSLTGQFFLNGEQRSVLPYKKDFEENMSSDFRNLVQKTAEALVHDAQSLVQNSGEKQKSLVTNTESVIMKISNLADEYESKIVDEPRRISETKMMKTIQSVRSTLNSVYNDESPEISRLVVSNSSSLLKADNKCTKMKIADSKCLEETIISIRIRLDRFSDNIIYHMKQTLQNSEPYETSNSKIDSLLERLVNQASSVLGLSSELMRMPLQILFQDAYQSESVAMNISAQCQDTLFDFLDSLEELAFSLKSDQLNQKIVTMGESLSIQFLKLLQILQKIQMDPQNKFFKSSMLDVFYEIQNGIKILLEFEEEVQKYCNSPPPLLRKVSFREKSPVKVAYDYIRCRKSSSSQDPLITTKEKIIHLNKISSDLSHPNHNFMTREDATQLKFFVELILKFAKVSTDLIGLSNQCRDHEEFKNGQSDISVTKEIAKYFEEITSTIQSCVYGKYRRLDEQLDNIKGMVKEIAMRSADLLTFYQKQEFKSSWLQLLQTVAIDLRNISKEILQFNNGYSGSQNMQDSGKLNFGYSSKSFKLTNE